VGPSAWAKVTSATSAPPSGKGPGPGEGHGPAYPADRHEARLHDPPAAGGGPPGAPPARDRKEVEARDLFHAAELEWRDPEKFGEAIEKYRMILRDYVGTPVAIRNMVFITKRSEAGKDYVLAAPQMKPSGPFVQTKIDDALPAWTLSRDVSGPEEGAISPPRGRAGRAH
jgi:hypothetical protein